MPLDEINQNVTKLLEAKEYIREHGWCRFHLKEIAKGHVCMNGALWEVGGLMAQRYLVKAIDPAANPLKEFDNKHIVPDWNNAKGRTKEEVFAMFDKAIEMATTEEFN